MDNDNLIENIRTFFKEKYDGINGSESFLSFEPIGSPINSEDFMDEAGNESAHKALEQLSVIGDRIPEISDTYFTDTSRLSTAYSILVNTLQLNSEFLDDGIASTFLSLKSSALAKLEHFESASIVTPQGKYLPVHPSIEKWYDPDSPVWTKKSFEVNHNQQSKSKKKKANNETFAWRSNFKTNPKVLKALSSEPIQKQTKFKVSKSKQTPIILRPTFFSNSKAVPPAVKNPKPKVKVKSLKLKTNHIQKAFVLKEKHQKLQNKKLIEWKDLKVLQHLDISDRLQLTGQIAAADNASLKPVNSSSFKMSFEYSIVKLRRPWYDSSLFDLADWWHCKTLKEGFFSTGEKDETNDGILKSFTTAMILIKNLEIEASWSDTDKDNAKKSIALGNFNITDSKFHGNTLKSEGIQILGWICNVLPKLPLKDAPEIEK